MSRQCLSIEQMQHLKELGVDTSKASCSYDIHKNTNTFELLWGFEEDSNDVMFDTIPAFTLQDILDILPKSTKYGQLQIRFCEYPDGTYGNEVTYDSIEHKGVFFFCEDLIDSAYEMLCLCIKEGYVKTNKED